MYRISSFILIALALGFSSCYRSAEERRMRNIIAFNDSVPVVEDSIRAMESLLQRLPDAEPINYWIMDGNFALNSKAIGKFDQLRNNQRIDTIAAFNSFSREEVEKLLSLAAFLNDNYITSAYSHLQVGRFVFSYKYMAGDGYDEVRNIMIINNGMDTSSTNFTVSQKILDRKAGLVLMAPNDAEIY